MRKFRHKSLDYFLARPLPTWGGNVAEIDFDNIYYYIQPTEKQASKWEDLPADILDTWDKLGIPEAEKKYLAGRRRPVRVGGRLPQAAGRPRGAGRALPRHGLGPARARGHRQAVLRDDHPAERQQVRGAQLGGLVGRLVHLRAAGRRRSSCRSRPTSASTPENMGQFERTLIIVDEGAYVHYVEGCTAPIYSSDSLHSAVVEIVVKPRGRCRYTTIQNWSNNVYNLVTKRAVAYEDATMEWVDGNLGSKLTMKYPAIWLMGERAHGEVLSIAFAGKGQHQDAGGKVVHVAPNTTSVITSKSISKDGGRAGYRGLLEVAKGARRLEVEGRLRRADPRRGVALGHLPVHPASTRTTSTSATRRRSRRSARSSSSTS